ncbi:unnamed protein product, partial [Closterium sp. NIES-54]
MDATFRIRDIEGLSISDKTNPLKPPCDSCLRGKMSKAPFPTGGDKRTARPLELVHSDIMDLGDAHPSLRYVLTLKDDYTNYLWVAPLVRQSDMAAIFSAWHREMKTKLPTKPLAALRTDNGGEYTANAFTYYLSSHGVVHQTSLPHTTAEWSRRTGQSHTHGPSAGNDHRGQPFFYVQALCAGVCSMATQPYQLQRQPIGTLIVLHDDGKGGRCLNGKDLWLPLLLSPSPRSNGPTGDWHSGITGLPEAHLRTTGTASNTTATSTQPPSTAAPPIHTPLATPL